MRVGTPSWAAIGGESQRERVASASKERTLVWCLIQTVPINYDPRTTFDERPTGRSPDTILKAIKHELRSPGQTFYRMLIRMLIILSHQSSGRGWNNSIPGVRKAQNACRLVLREIVQTLLFAAIYGLVIMHRTIIKQP